MQRTFGHFSYLDLSDTRYYLLYLQKRKQSEKLDEKIEYFFTNYLMLYIYEWANDVTPTYFDMHL